MSPAVFKRDQFTWLAYFMLAYFAYLQSAIGPLVNFLRVELNLNYAEGALHGSAYAVGMIIAGIIGGSIARRWGRYAMFWGGGAGMAIGALFLILGKNSFVTVASAFVMGLIGTLLLSTINSSLSDKHGVNRAVALTEANISASISSMLAPLLLGGFAAIGLGWRAAIVVFIAAWVIAALFSRTIAIPAIEIEEQLPDEKIKRTQSAKLPAAFWVFWILVMLGGALESGLGFWGAAFLNQAVGLPLETAAGLIGVMFAAMVVGRVVGSRLTRTISTNTLLVSTLLIVLVGFPIFWLSPVPVLNIIGLFIMGLGIANLFPLALSAAASAAASQADTATAYVSLAAGLSILIVPQLLGFIADQIGIKGAFGLLGVIAVAAMIVVVGNARQSNVKLKNDQTQPEA
jgi:MFS family permease